MSASRHAAVHGEGLDAGPGFWRHMAERRQPAYG